MVGTRENIDYLYLHCTDNFKREKINMCFHCCTYNQLHFVFSFLDIFCVSYFLLFITLFTNNKKAFNRKQSILFVLS